MSDADCSDSPTANKSMQITFSVCRLLILQFTITAPSTDFNPVYVVHTTHQQNFGNLWNMAASSPAPTSSGNADITDKTRALPAIGDVLDWSGVSHYQGDSLRSVLSADETRGVIHPRRPIHRLLEVLDVESGSLKPGLSLVLEEPLNAVDWVRPSQWRARVVHSSEAAERAQLSENAGEGPDPSKAVQQTRILAPHHVVLKLLYYDAREKGEDVDLDGFDFVSAPDLVKLAASEAACYAAMGKCQGSIVPYSYGFYKVTIPRCPVLSSSLRSARLPTLMLAVPAWQWARLYWPSRRTGRWHCAQQVCTVSAAWRR